MTLTEIKEKFDAITVWKRGGERAPHKPLLALYAIGRALRGEPIDEVGHDVLDRGGVPTRRVSPLPDERATG